MPYAPRSIGEPAPSWCRHQTLQSDHCRLQPDGDWRNNRYRAKAHVDVKRLPDVLRGGFADSPPLQILGPRMAEHRLEPRLGAITLMQKDVTLAEKMTIEVGAKT